MKMRLVVTVLLAFGFGVASAHASVAESETAANTRGYQLLRSGDVQGAIAVFLQNAANHPDSANVYDSLGEAYVAAGDTTRAIESYRKALAINPRSRSARSALERLTGERRVLRPSVLFHVAAGVAGLVSGLAAMVLRKGSRRHALAGRAFVVAMLLMGGSGALIAFLDPLGEKINVPMGVLACYLVTTAWLTAARRAGTVRWFDPIATFVAMAVAFSLVKYGIEAAASETGAKDGIPAAAYFVFSAVPFLATLGDIRMIEAGGISGARRIARHLWRMCTALLIAVGSFFLGQPQVFPEALQSAGLRAIPVLAVLGALIAWMIRVRFTNAHQRMAVPAAAVR
jgi:uncharacterized membrane protein